MSFNINSSRTLLNQAKIPVIGLGTWRAGTGHVETAVYHALKSGYRHLDCAWTYENEEEVGSAIKRALKDIPNLTRGDLFVTTKVWNSFHLPSDVEWCVNDSLRKLGLDYVDLVLIHWPIAFKNIPGNKFAQTEDKTDRYFEENVTPEQTWRALEQFVDSGKVRAIGTSNHSKEEIQAIQKYAVHKPVCNQIEVHPYFNQRTFIEWTLSQGMVVTAYSPLGNVARDEAEAAKSPLLDPVIHDIGKTHSRSPAQIILRWHVQSNHVVIPKSATPSRIEENINIFDFVLSDEEMAKIDQLGEKNIRFINPPFRAKNELWY